MHRNPDTDTGSCRPRLFRSFSFCRHTLHIAVDCKHPADTKLKNLGETLYFATIALEAQPTGHTFLPITQELCKFQTTTYLKHYSEL